MHFADGAAQDAGAFLCEHVAIHTRHIHIYTSFQSIDPTNASILYAKNGNNDRDCSSASFQIHSVINFITSNVCVLDLV